METTNVTNPENVQGMFLCWLQVSRRMERTMTEAEWHLRCWLLDAAVHRTIRAREWSAALLAIREHVDAANCGRLDGDSLLAMWASMPDEVSSGYIRIVREDDPKVVMNIPVIDWRGDFMLSSI